MSDDLKSAPETGAISEAGASSPIQSNPEIAISLQTPGDGDTLPPEDSSPNTSSEHQIASDTAKGSAQDSPIVADKQGNSPSEFPSTGQGTSENSEEKITELSPPAAILKAATWAVNEPTEPWCPGSLDSQIGFTPDYKHERTWSESISSGWELAAATKRGRMHAHHGTFREDALWGTATETFIFFVVCDGAGASKLSRIGSEFTARTLAKLVKGELLKHQTEINNCSKESLPINLRQILFHCVDSVARDILSLADKSGMEPKDFRCTLLTVLQYRHPTGGILLFGNVGDGFLAVKKRGQEAERIGTSDSGAFSGEVTCFMPDSPVGEFYRKSLEANVPIPEEDVEAYMLCTDGIEDPFFPIPRNVNAIFTQLFEGYRTSIQDVSYQVGQEPESVIQSADPGGELLKWLSYEKRGENDDRTIALIYRKELVFSPSDEISSKLPQDTDSTAPSLGTGDDQTSRFNISALSTGTVRSSQTIRLEINRALLFLGGLLFLLGLAMGTIIGLLLKKSFLPGN